MDNRYSAQSQSAPRPSSRTNVEQSQSQSQSLTGYNVRSRALDIASRAKARAASAYAVAAAAAAASSAMTPSDPNATSADTPSPSAALARLANGAKTKAVNAYGRAASAVSDSIERERDRRRSSQALSSWEDGHLPFDPEPRYARQSAAYRPQQDTTDDSTPKVSQDSQFDRPKLSIRTSSGRTSPLMLLRGPNRPLSPTSTPRRPSSPSSQSPGLSTPTFAQYSSASPRHLALAGQSKSSSNVLRDSGLIEGFRTTLDNGRKSTVRAFSTGPPRKASAGRSGANDAIDSSMYKPVAPGMPLHAPGSEEAVLLPGWSVRRRRRDPKSSLSSDESTGGPDIHVLLSGVVLRTPQTPSRSQRIFLRVAKQIAALPRMPSSSLSLQSGRASPRSPLVIPTLTGAMSEEPTQIEDLSAFPQSIDSSSSSVPSARPGLPDSIGSPPLSTTSGASSSVLASPSLEPEDGDTEAQRLGDRIIHKVIQDGNDDMLLKAMEKIGVLPTEDKPPKLSERELEEAERQLQLTEDSSRAGRDDAQQTGGVHSPTVLGSDAAASAQAAETRAHGDGSVPTDAIPPLSLDTSVEPDNQSIWGTSSSSSSSSSPSKLRKIFGSSLSNGSDSPKMRATTEPSTPLGTSGATTPVMLPRSESSSRLSRFAESVKRRATNGPDSGSLSSSVSSLSSNSAMSPRLNPVGPGATTSTQAAASFDPRANLNWPSGSGVWTERSFDQLVTLQQNFDARLRAFWTFRVPDRTIWIEILPIFEGEDEQDVTFEPPSTSVRETGPESQKPSTASNSRPLLAVTKVISSTTGQFSEKFVIPWEKVDAYCRQFYSGEAGTTVRRPENIIGLKKRAVLRVPGSASQPGRWIATDLDDDEDAVPAVRVISDVDDTVKRSDVTQGVRKIFHSVFVKPFEEVQIPGVADWYRTLRREAQTRFHFVSNTPLELHGLVCGFLETAKFPRAHLHLKHYPTGTRNLLSSWLEPAGERKKGAVVAILDEFPSSKFILIGDSGELDMELYTAIAAERREQIIGVFIRNVSSSLKPDAALQVGNAVRSGGEAAGGAGSAARARAPAIKRNATSPSLPTYDSFSGVAVGPESDNFTTNTFQGMDEASRKREAAFALRVQRARALLPPEIPLLFYTEGEKATTEISLDLIAKAKAKMAKSA
ncbi:hypothetical protein OC846_002394 [Tilletia horrida]|uniref:Phosphatidate phosphatase APP1 catalytic domain-containing protein n=1 Tax=Tilletia horrida TaxID=155126 RepID=A0AAN6GX51_9BASI|nr:hypothetical protein OC846_002394 [Tilletia horrida]KAK0567638.1 hypothetical protein OC861_002593 [Tilletia horrida]